MSLKASLKVFETYLPDVHAKIVALAFADYAHKDGTSMHPSIATIVKMTSVTRRTVQRKVQLLLYNRFFIRDGFGPFGTHNYILDMAWDREWISKIEGGVTVTPCTDDAGGAYTMHAGGVTLAQLLGVQDTPDPLTLVNPIDKYINRFDLALEALKSDMAKSTFETWVRQLKLTAIETSHEIAIIDADGGYAADWLNSRLAETFNELMGCRVVFVTDDNADQIREALSKKVPAYE